MKRDASIYLKDIQENIERVERFVEGMSYEEFVEDERTSFAVIRCIEIIGEAAKHVSEEIKDKYLEVPWKDIAGMRDKVIHFYFGVNLEMVWMVVKKNIPELKPYIEQALKDYRQND
jgi:uncharacterized protein with HEPN domain